jgi:hypothetical protein
MPPGERDIEFTLNNDTGEVMVHLHGHDAVGWDKAQALLEQYLGKATRVDRRVKPKTAVQRIVGKAH